MDESLDCISSLPLGDRPPHEKEMQMKARYDNKSPHISRKKKNEKSPSISLSFFLFLSAGRISHLFLALIH